MDTAPVLKHIPLASKASSVTLAVGFRASVLGGWLTIIVLMMDFSPVPLQPCLVPKRFDFTVFVWAGKRPLMFI